MPRSPTSRPLIQGRVSPAAADRLAAIPAPPGAALQALLELHGADPLVAQRAEQIAASEAAPGRPRKK